MLLHLVFEKRKETFLIGALILNFFFFCDKVVAFNLIGNTIKKADTMADENVQLPSDQSLDYHVITLFQRLESLRKDTSNRCIGWNTPHSMHPKANMQTEIRTLEFWR